MSAPEWLRQAIEEHGEQAAREGWGHERWVSVLGTDHRAREVRYAVEVGVDNYVPKRARKRLGLTTREVSDSSPTPPPPQPTSPRIESEGEGLDRTITAKGMSVRTLADLLAAAEVDLGAWEVKRWKANTWEVATRDGVVPVWQVRADMERRILPLRPARASVKRRTQPKPPPRPVRRALFVPDSQHGFRWRDGYSRLEPMHDRRACDAVLQLARHWKPDEIVLLGDMADLAAWSTKYPRDPSLRQTTQPTIDALHWWLCELRNAAPYARIRYTAGNHEERIRKAAVTQLAEAVSLRAAGESRPALDWARLLRLDELEIEYVGPYGESFWLWDSVEVTHGSGGGSRAGLARDAERAHYHRVHGHVHKIGVHGRKVDTPQGPRVVQVMTPGCLCRIDGAVPGVSASPDWQHGVGVGVFDPASGLVQLSAMPITDGVLLWPDGTVIEGSDRAEEIAEATGWGQLAS